MSQKPYTIYDLESGDMIQTGFAPESQMDAMRTCVEEGQGFIEKPVDFNTQRVSKDGRVIKRRKADVDKERKAAAMGSLKMQRNHLLSQSDWTQMPDAKVDQDAWMRYREALRDLPENTEDPENPVFPEPPNT